MNIKRPRLESGFAPGAQPWCRCIKSDKDLVARQVPDEPREFNLPTSPQRRINYMQEKLPTKYGGHLKSTAYPAVTKTRAAAIKSDRQSMKLKVSICCSFYVNNSIVMVRSCIRTEDMFCTGYNLTYLPVTDTSENIQHSNGALRTINQVFTTTKIQKYTMLKAYKVLARPVLMYGSEVWAVRNSDDQRLTTAEMRFLRRTAGYSLLDHKRNELITKSLKIIAVYENFNHYRQKWLNHVNRMDRSRLSKTNSPLYTT
ncbi:hypothetical protein ANN_12889 [Periplaneta americana]|uniref:Uncharacterized protein n=1 Tax=Periplaneta americana TaxID=6978 RepID=A0ABQ8TK22_PERAM|nr:hypothetical protein ANN_12889 [Periplaneta americana]